jgi:transcriptional regulator with XRE-family HTH domain
MPQMSESDLADRDGARSGGALDPQPAKALERLERGDGDPRRGRGEDGGALSALDFRNVEASPDDPVSDWPLEAIQTALERGSLRHWRRLAHEIQADPWGPVARRVEEVLAYGRPYGAANLMEKLIAKAREDAEKSEREAVATEVNELISRSGLTRGAFASRIGTSPSRLSTYATGKVTPSAALLMRMRRIADAAKLPVPDPDDIELAETLLGLTPLERLRALRRYAHLGAIAREQG